MAAADTEPVASNYRMQLAGRGPRVSPNWLGQWMRGRFCGARRALQLMLGR